MLHDETIMLDSDQRKFILSRLSTLSKETYVIPQYHELTEIQPDIFSGAREEGGFSDVYRVPYLGQVIGVKMIRSFVKRDNMILLRVSLGFYSTQIT